MSKWHVREIKKGVYGELSKIQEELDEAVDAEEQQQTLMLFFELSDIIGAVGGVAKKYGMSLDDIYRFCELRSKIIEEENADKNFENGLAEAAKKISEIAHSATVPSRVYPYMEVPEQRYPQLVGCEVADGVTEFCRGCGRLKREHIGYPYNTRNP